MALPGARGPHLEACLIVLFRVPNSTIFLVREASFPHADSPNTRALVIDKKQAPVAGHCKLRRCAPSIDVTVAGAGETSNEVVVIANRLPVFESHTHHLVAVKRVVWTRSMDRYKRRRCDIWLGIACRFRRPIPGVRCARRAAIPVSGYWPPNRDLAIHRRETGSVLIHIDV